MALMGGGAGGGGAAGTVTSVTASSPLASSGGTTPDVSLTGLIPLANAGSGISNARTSISSIGAQNNVTVPTSWLIWTGSGTSTISGLVAQTDGTEVTISNQSSGAITLLSQSVNSSSANRFSLPNNNSVVVAAGSSLKVRYMGSITKWVESSYYSALDGSGSAGGVAYWTSNTSISSQTSRFSFDPSLGRLGLQVNYLSALGVVHSKSETALTINTATLFAASLIQFVLPNSPSSASINLGTPNLAQQSSSTATPNYSGSGYIADGSSTNIQYRITPGNTGSGQWGVANYVATSTDDGSNNPYQVDIIFGGPSSNFGIDEWAVERNINGGGYNDYIIVNSSSFNDNNTGWTGGSPDLSNQADDFLSNGTVRDVNFYGTKVSPISTVIVSITPFNLSFDDGNTGAAYKMDVSITGGDNPFRLDFDTTSHHYNPNGNFSISPSGLIAGPAVVTPSSYGYQANGSVLNISYDYFASNSLPVYAAAPLNSTTTDPNDNLWYYVSMSGYTPSTGKVVKNSTDGKSVTGSPLLDDGITLFNESPDTTPTSYYAPALFTETHGTTDADFPGGVYRSIDGSYVRHEFQDSASTIIGYVEANGTSVKFRFGATGPALTISSSTAAIDTGLMLSGPLTLSEGANISVGTSSGTQVATTTSEKLAFHGSAAVVQKASSAQAAVSTTAATQTVPYGYTTQAQADAIVTLVNEIRAALVEKGIIKGSA